jgi:stress-induced morphogen
MAMHAKEIEGFIQTAFPDAEIKLVDLAGDGDHYELTVISKAFEGKSRIAQHQMVYAALQGHMGSTLHALALKTKAA